VFKGWPPCDICGEPVGERDGTLSVCYRRIAAFDTALKEWEEEHPHGLVDMGYPTFPNSIPWFWGHKTCSPEACDGSCNFWIDAVTLNSVGKALNITLRLLEKPWFPNTNWERAVRRLYDLPHA
jgi:hypothetical protein